MGDSVVVIARTSGPGAFQLTDRVGVLRPAHCTALGKIMLASLRPDQLKRFLERVELKPSTKKSITDPAVLLRDIAEIRRSAIAFDDGSTVLGRLASDDTVSAILGDADFANGTIEVQVFVNGATQPCLIDREA